MKSDTPTLAPADRERIIDELERTVRALSYLRPAKSCYMCEHYMHTALVGKHDCMKWGAEIPTAERESGCPSFEIVSTPF